MALLLPTSLFYILGLFNSYVSCLPGELIAGAPTSAFRDSARSRSSPFRSHLRLFDLIELFAGAVQRCLPPRQQRQAPSSPAHGSGAYRPASRNELPLRRRMAAVPTAPPAETSSLIAGAVQRCLPPHQTAATYLITGAVLRSYRPAGQQLACHRPSSRTAWCPATRGLFFSEFFPYSIACRHGWRSS